MKQASSAILGSGDRNSLQPAHHRQRQDDRQAVDKYGPVRYRHDNTAVRLTASTPKHPGTASDEVRRIAAAMSHSEGSQGCTTPGDHSRHLQKAADLSGTGRALGGLSVRCQPNGHRPETGPACAAGFVGILLSGSTPQTSTPRRTKFARYPGFSTRWHNPPGPRAQYTYPSQVRVAVARG